MWLCQITIKLHDLNVAMEEGLYDEAWMHNFTSVIRSMDSLAHKKPVPSALVVDAWLDHCKVSDPTCFILMHCSEQSTHQLLLFFS